MTKIPNLNDYPIEVLICLGNSSDNECIREEIRNIIVEKVLLLNLPMFILINKFIRSNDILEEVYAKVILIRLGNEYYNLEESILEKILSLMSLDELTLYGQKVCSLDVRKKCEELFWHRVLMEDNSFELNRKNAMYRRRILVEKIKTEGEKNDKY